MLFVIDIGNSTINLSLMERRRVRARFSLSSRGSESAVKAQSRKLCREINDRYASIEDCIVCSVVPSLTRIFSAVVERVFRFEPIVVGQHIQVPIKNRYKNPQQVGPDRLVGAYAARCLYGQPTVIIDLGTAVTFDVVSAQGVYEGGLILPGIEMATQSLFEKTSLLPKVETIHAPKNLIGRDTEESILSGIFFGYASMCEGLIQRFERQMGKKAKIVLTGGNTALLKKYLHLKKFFHDPDLVFKGLALIYDEAIKKT